MGIGGGSVLVPWRPAFWIAAEVVLRLLLLLLLLFIQSPTLNVRYARRPRSLPAPCALTPPSSHTPRRAPARDYQHHPPSPAPIPLPLTQQQKEASKEERHQLKLGSIGLLAVLLGMNPAGGIYRP